MKPTSFLINTSHGPTVGEAALIETLKEQKIAGAAIDVFDQEPLPTEPPFRHLRNVLAIPRLGYGTRSLYEIFYECERRNDCQRFKIVQSIDTGERVKRHKRTSNINQLWGPIA